VVTRVGQNAGMIFDDFQARHGEPIDPLPVPGEAMELFEKLLPSALLTHWRDVGWAGWADGLLWTVDPRELDGVPGDWLGSDVQDAAVIARTAFCDLFIFAEGAIHYVDVHRGGSTQITPDVEVLMDGLLVNDVFVGNGLQGDVYAEALPRLGPPSHDTCYAFVPALALGGPGTAASIQRADLREQLTYLAQVHGGSTAQA
jgi:hypothetical protein